MMNLIPKVILGSVLGIFLSPYSAAQDAPDTTAPPAPATADEQPVMVEYLFVQHANGVTLEDGVLTLEGIGNTVLFFSDRPHRIVGRTTLARFIESWDDGDDSFQHTPPNAVLTVKRADELRDLTVILRDPVLTDQTLVYAAEVLDGPTSGSGGSAALFIDAFGLEIGKGRRGSGKPGGESRLGRPGKPGGESRLGDPGGLSAEVGDGDSEIGDPGGLGGEIVNFGRRATDVPREILDDML